MFSVDKTTDKIHVAVSGKSSPVALGIDIQHPSKQRPIPNPCSYYTICSHIWLLSPDSNGFRCTCPTGMELASDNSTCRNHATQMSFLLQYTIDSLVYYQHRLIGNDTQASLPRNFFQILNFAYDAHSNSAILDATLDKYSNRSYYSWNLLTGKVGVFSVPIDPVFIDMDIDPYTGYIYGVNYYSVYMRKSTGFQQVVVTEPHDILFITLAPELNLMFINTSM